jgi:flagellin
MSLVVNTNVGALDAYRNLSRNQAMQQDAMSKLSSGLRINKAADDAAGLSISQGLTSQINGMTVAVRNAQDGINVAQIADGALATSQQILQRMRDLTVQAANSGSNGTGSSSDALTAIKSELNNLASSLDKVASGTKFNGNNLLDGSYTGQFQIGANADSGSDTSNTAQLGVYSTASVASVASAASVASTASTPSAPSTASAPSAAAKGFSSSDLNVGSGSISGVTDHASAQSFLNQIDAAIKSVSNARATIGAFQNSLNYTISNLQSTIENVSASRSNITDADLATEVTSMTQAQILSQAATSVLAQANSSPQAVLKLLQ